MCEFTTGQELKALGFFSHGKSLLSPKLGKKRYSQSLVTIPPHGSGLGAVSRIPCTGNSDSVMGIQGGIPDFLQDRQPIPPISQNPCDSLSRASQGCRDLQELRESKESAATPAFPDPRGTEGLQVHPEFRDRR